MGIPSHANPLCHPKTEAAITYFLRKKGYIDTPTPSVEEGDLVSSDNDERTSTIIPDEEGKRGLVDSIIYNAKCARVEEVDNGVVHVFKSTFKVNGKAHRIEVAVFIGNEHPRCVMDKNWMDGIKAYDSSDKDVEAYGSGDTNFGVSKITDSEPEPKLGF